MGDSKSRDVPITVYQSGPDCTVITFTYGDNTQLGAFSGDIGFRIQAVEGYFIRDPYVVPTFEGDGSEWTEFTITLPPFNSYEKIQPTGTFKPAIQTTAAVPLTPQNPEQTSILSVLAAVCIITLPISILTYQYGKRKPSTSTLN